MGFQFISIISKNHLHAPPASILGAKRAGINTHECAVKLTGWCRFFTTHDESIRQPLLYIRDKR
jgi:hypothetical protein